jgi:non-specific protein-tyrosine kinase
MQGVVDTLGLGMSWRELRSQVQVYSVPQTQLIEITAQADSRGQALRIAGEIARQFILHSPTASKDEEDEEGGARHFVRQRVALLQEKISAGQEHLDGLENTMINAGDPAEQRALRNEIQRLENVISSWENNYARLLALIESEEDSNVISVIEPAQARESPASPDVQMNVLLAAGVGLILALVLVTILEYVDDTLKSEDDLEQALGLTPLGAVYRMKVRTEHKKLASAQYPFSPASEAYRMIRSNIQFMSVDKPRKTMLVASAGPGEGKSLTAANLAIVMAQAGLNTILVDADLRQPRQHALFRLTNQAGLTDLLRSGSVEVQDLLKSTPIDKLWVLNSGPQPPNPSELLGSERMSRVLKLLSNMVDIVILDSTPLLTMADSAVLSNQVDGVVLVIDSRRTRRAAVHKALQHLKQADARIWGAVLNQVSTKSAFYYFKETFVGRVKTMLNDRVFKGQQKKWMPPPAPSE